jgi:hypothetical protein
MRLIAGLMLFVLTASRVLAQCTGCFNPSFLPSMASFQTDYAKSFASGDFDGDGIPDVVAAVGDGIGFLRGTGSGRFAPMVHIDSAGSDSIAAADFNGDGKLDVATAGANVSIFLGNGDGTFQPPIEYTADFYGSTRLVAADFNGDGIPDLALQAFSLFRFRVYFGNGDGTLQAPVELSPPSGDIMLTGDFNGDGNPDLLTGGTSVFVFLGDGKGGFSSPIETEWNGAPGVAGDFNRDGLDDVAVDSFDGVKILESNGDGTFTAGAFYSVPYGTGGMAVGDMNRDGNQDLVVDGYQTGLLYVFPGAGDGTFGSPTVIAQGSQPGPLLLRDFDRNGWLDIAVLRQNSAVEVLLADASGQFVVPAVYPAGGGSTSTYSSIATGALTSPGAVDAAVAIIENDFVTPALGILPGDGAGGFGAPILVPLASTPRWIASGSFHAPGLDDLAVATDVGIQVVRSNGDGTFQALAPFGDLTAFVAAGDFNGDGKIDLAWGSSVQISLGNGDGTFSPGPPIPGSPSASSIAVGDLNGDDKLDLVLIAGPDVTVLLGDGSGGFVVGNTYAVTINVAPTVQIADFDGDGKIDVAVAHGLGYSPVLSIFWGNGDGTLGAPTDVAGNFETMEVLAADLNGDGRAEAVFEAYSSVTILAFHPDRTFSTSSWVTPTIAPFAAIADLDGDGKPDLLAAGVDPSGLGVGVLRNTICVPSRYVVAQQPSTCDASGVVFDAQPVVKIVDGGDNLMTCSTDAITAALVPGTGAPGAVLSGQTSVAAVGGVAAFADLSVDRPGMRYVLDFSGPLGSTRSRTFSQDIGVVISGPAAICDGTAASFRTGSGGYDLYQWTLDGAPISRAAAVAIAGAGAGSHSLGVQVSADGCSASTAVDLEVQSSPSLPTIVGPSSVRVGQTGIVGSVSFHEGNTYLWTLAGGTITGGQGTSQIVFDAAPPGTTMVLSVVEFASSGCPSPAAVFAVQVDFADAGSGPFRDAIDTLARNGISSGCGGGNFCPSAPVTRAQMAVFLLKAEHGPGYVPGGFGQPFIDVPPGSFAADWINQLYFEGIASGCAPNYYCPDAAVTRAQMAVLLLKTEHGSSFVPPSCTGVFADVECSPTPAFAVDWIEQLYREGVTVGCGGGNYCPDAPNTRGQMAVFITKTFNLQ